MGLFAFNRARRLAEQKANEAPKKEAEPVQAKAEEVKDKPKRKKQTEAE